MPLTFRYTAHSEVGLVRRNNQDSAYASPDMLMVADGMGGAAAGDLASAVAATELAQADADLPALLAAASERRPTGAPPGLPEGPAGDLLAVLASTLQRANARLAALVEADRTLDGMGTTVCGLALAGDDRAALVNIGDSRAYLLRDGELRRVSRDHSWVQTLVDEGRITEQEALEHPHRSLILKVLNGKPVHQPDLQALELRAGDRVLVCSDGLCGLVTDAAIAAEAGAPDRAEAVAALVRLAHEAGGYDNITLVLADVVEGEPEGVHQLLGSVTMQDIPDLAPTTRLPAVAATPTEPPLPAPDATAAPPDELRYAPQPARSVRSRLRAVLGVVLPLLLIAGGATGWYAYSQTRFYIGPAGPAAALYQGTNAVAFGRPLSHVVRTGPAIADLPLFTQQQVTATYDVDDLGAGLAKLDWLQGEAARCQAVRAARARNATPTPTPAASPSSASPSGAPAAPAASPGVTGPSAPATIALAPSASTAPRAGSPAPQDSGDC